VRFYKEILAPSPYQGEGWGEVLQGFLHSLRCSQSGLIQVRVAALLNVQPVAFLWVKSRVAATSSRPANLSRTSDYFALN
jgi:hypothetical protein